MCRLGDLKALEDTRFVPSAMPELGPFLVRAIESAGGEVDTSKPMFGSMESWDTGRHVMPLPNQYQPPARE